jgi:virulence-associated protein VapD
MISMNDEDQTTHYHYKRWLWVQFPWCTIDVHSDISNIMELFSGGSSKGGDSSVYISATKENELAKATLQILHAAKQRSKKTYSNGNKSLNQSQASSVVNTSLKKRPTAGKKSSVGASSK